MYTMKDICRMTEIPYETLKFYCNKGLVPNVKRDENNYRLFDDRDLAWIQSLKCLKKCGLSIQDMLTYMHLCLKGMSTIEDRKEILAQKRIELLEKMDELQASIAYIDQKEQYFDDVRSGKKPYSSNLIKLEQEGDEDIENVD